MGVEEAAVAFTVLNAFRAEFVASLEEKAHAVVQYYCAEICCLFVRMLQLYHLEVR